MKNFVYVAARVATFCARFVEVRRQQRMLRAMRELDHPGVLADLNAASASDLE
jgi:hypothetical protein